MSTGPGRTGATAAQADAPVDPDVDLRSPGQVRELARRPWAVIGAIAAGGAIGATARHAADVLLPHGPGQLPLSTLLVNVSGALLIGALMVAVEARPGARLMRPFLGTGVLGGYTTFSTHVVDVQHLLEAGRPGWALLYLGGTLFGALAAVGIGVAAAEAAVRAARGRGGEHGRKEPR
ncbi:FluC/FEX family fluoride channel [Nocardiopsis chromatogenes]|uniref:FluC/FEX family fluoride channel n=1 Tax=Nocardiopsis chromatogenes TaxID=280239 RepID=UPI00034717B9|nr:CrcB family protein [Nocardiopsis chromatogenes]